MRDAKAFQHDAPFRERLGRAFRPHAGALAMSLALAATAAAAPADPGPRSQVLDALPLHFEANEGHLERGVRFLARGPGYEVLLTGADATLVLGDSAAAPRTVHMRL